MRREFNNPQPVRISAGAPNTVHSQIEIGDFGNSTAVREVVVQVDISHTWTGDLSLHLVSPKGRRVLLVQRRGGSADDFRNTIFDARANASVVGAKAPFRGVFRPEGSLQELDGEPAGGTWTLEVMDHARHDGGFLNRWSLTFEDAAEETSPFRIDVRFLGGLTPKQQDAFAAAAERWSKVIVGDLPEVEVEGELIDDVLIDARGTAIDGIGGVLGQAGPTHLRFGSRLPAKGIMEFDSADLARMEADGSLHDVILHEMAHVLGVGTLWRTLLLIANEGGVDPRFLGVSAMAEYAKLSERSESTGVPVANTGGPGTRDGHWRETVFGDELLTGFLSGAVRPLSAMSIASLRDLGYVVDMSVADPFVLPSALRLAELGVFAGARSKADTCQVLPTQPTVLPPTRR